MVALQQLLEVEDLIDIMIPLLDPSGEPPFVAVQLASTCTAIGLRLAREIAAVRAKLPPPYSADALDVALANGTEAAAPLLREAYKRMKKNIDTIWSRLLQMGYPIAAACPSCQRPYLTPLEDPDLDELLAPLHARNLCVPLAVTELWRACGGFVLADPSRPQDTLDWWRATHPEVLSAASGIPDPLWIEVGFALERAPRQHGCLSLWVGWWKVGALVVHDRLLLAISAVRPLTLAAWRSLVGSTAQVR